MQNCLKATVFICLSWIALSIQSQLAFSAGFPLCITAQQRTDQKEQRNADDPKIDRWIKQLASDTYALRIQAMEKLFLLGDKAKSKLELAVKNGPQESVRRARYLLSLIEMGITPDTPRARARNILRFQTADPRQRTAILRELYAENQYGLVLNLLELTDDSFQKQWIFQNWLPGDFVRHTANLANAEKEFVEKLLHPIFWRTRPNKTLHLATVLEQLDDQFAILKKRIVDPKLSKTRRQLETMVTARLAMRLHGLQAAKLYLDGLEKEQRAQLLTDWYLRKQNWAKVIEIDDEIDPLVEDEVDPIKLFSTINTPQKLVLLQWAGQQKRYQKLIDTIVKETDKNDSGGLQLTVNYLVVNREIDQAIKLFKQNELSGNHFKLLCTANRYEQAFKLLGWGKTKSEQLRWYGQHAKTLAQLNEKLRKRYDLQTYRQANKIFDDLLAIADQIGQLGQTELAVQLFDLLADADQEMDYRAQNRRRRILRTLKTLGDNDLIWHFVEQRFQDRELRTTLSMLIENSSVASFWYSIVEEKIKDPLDVVKTVAAIMNSTVVPTDQTANLDQWLEIGFEKAYQLPVKARGSTLINLAATLEANQRDSQAIELYREAVDSGYESANRILGQVYLERQQWEKARLCFQANYELSEDWVSRYLAGVCEKKMGHLKQYRQGRKRLDFIVGEGHKTSVLAYYLVSLRQHQEVVDYLQPILESTLFSSSNYNHLQKQVATANRELKNEHAALTDQMAFISSLQHLRLNTDVLDLNADGRNAELGYIQTLLHNKNIERAWQRIERFNLASPADSSLAEDLVPLLEKVGRKDLADKLFDSVAAAFEKILAKYPNSALHLNNYAWICARCNRRTDKCLKLAQAATRLQPHNASYLDTLAEIHFLQGNRSKALELINRCIQIEPKKTHYRRQLARFSK